MARSTSEELPGNDSVLTVRCELSRLGTAKQRLRKQRGLCFHRLSIDRQRRPTGAARCPSRAVVLFYAWSEAAARPHHRARRRHGRTTVRSSAVAWLVAAAIRR